MSLTKLAPALALSLPALIPNTAFAETIRITPTDDFAEIERAQPGDEVVIEPGTYRFRVFLNETGTAAMPIVIRAADPSTRRYGISPKKLAEDFPGSSTCRRWVQLPGVSSITARARCAGADLGRARLRPATALTLAGASLGEVGNTATLSVGSMNGWVSPFAPRDGHVRARRRRL